MHVLASIIYMPKRRSITTASGLELVSIRPAPSTCTFSKKYSSMYHDDGRPNVMMEEAGPVEGGEETARLAAAVVEIVVAVEIAEVAAMAVGIAEVAAMAVEENNQ